MGGRDNTTLIGETDETVPMSRISLEEVHAICHVSPNGFNSGIGMRIEPFHIPLWNLKREQHISLHASAWYPIRPIPETALPLASSHVEFTAMA